jgi:hypothetical protein
MANKGLMSFAHLMSAICPRQQSRTSTLNNEMEEINSNGYAIPVDSKSLAILCLILARCYQQ